MAPMLVGPWSWRHSESPSMICLNEKTRANRSARIVAKEIYLDITGWDMGPYRPLSTNMFQKCYALNSLKTIYHMKYKKIN